jgi:hypothetical protein
MMLGLGLGRASHLAHRLDHRCARFADCLAGRSRRLGRMQSGELVKHLRQPAFDAVEPAF